jgi:hypothetical protein
MNDFPFRTDGVYVRNILPKAIKGYKPILDTNKLWHATNYRENISSYEIIWIDFYKGSKSIPPHIKARFDTVTGEILSLVDNYFNNFTIMGDFDVTFNEDSFQFGNDDYTVYADSTRSPGILQLVVKKTNTNLFLQTDGIYQKEVFRFIPFVRGYLYF